MRSQFGPVSKKCEFEFIVYILKTKIGMKKNEKEIWDIPFNIFDNNRNGEN